MAVLIKPTIKNKHKPKPVQALIEPLSGHKASGLDCYSFSHLKNSADVLMNKYNNSSSLHHEFHKSTTAGALWPNMIK